MSLRHQRSPYRYHVDRFVTAALPQGSHLTGLDVGGPSPQRRPLGQRWETINQNPGARAEYLGFAEDLGTFEDHEFDIVQATDMLYLVVDIPKALGEMRRVLKEGGTLVASVPCMWPPSEAADWGRWSATGWLRAFETAGLCATVTPLGGKWTLLEQLWHNYADWWPPVLCRLDRTMDWPVAYGILAQPRVPCPTFGGQPISWATARRISEDGP